MRIWVTGILFLILIVGCAPEIEEDIIIAPQTPIVEVIEDRVATIEEIIPIKIPVNDTMEIIVIKDLNFFPKDISVPVGTTVVWENRDELRSNMVHMIKIHGVNVRSNKLLKDDSFNVTFDEKGEYNFFDVIHAKDMPDGSITVI